MGKEKIAEERIERLFDLADKRVDEGREELADRYVELARKIGMTCQVSISGDLKRRYCQNCHSYLKPGHNCMVRVNSKNKTVNYHCENCGEINRYGFRS